MKYNNIKQILLGFFLMFYLTASQANGLMMARTKQSFPEAMLKLQETIIELNYKISRVQRIDIGLTASGYETDKYRIVFFANEKEINHISNKYPHLVPYIPWKVAIFAEQQDTLLVSADPMLLSDKRHPQADKYLLKWKKDLIKIMSILRQSD